jgi:hypothetical protein
MNSNLTAKRAAIAAFVSLIQVAHAETKRPSFTPLEDLPPEARQQVIEKINNLSGVQEIDWEEVVAGIDEHGNLSIVPRSEAGLRDTGTPSCLGIIPIETVESK